MLQGWASKAPFVKDVEQNLWIYARHTKVAALTDLPKARATPLALLLKAEHRQCRSTTALVPCPARRAVCSAPPDRWAPTHSQGAPMHQPMAGVHRVAEPNPRPRNPGPSPGRLPRCWGALDTWRRRLLPCLLFNEHLTAGTFCTDHQILYCQNSPARGGGGCLPAGPSPRPG